MRTFPVFRVVILLGLLVVVSRTGADVDLWGHIQFGRDIVEQRAIPTEDPYSFTSDRSWINHEWLAEVIFYLAWAAGGALGLNIFKLLVVMSVGLIVAGAARASGATPRVELILVVIAVVFTYPRMQYVRPQLFSVICFALLLRSLWRFETGGVRNLLWLPLLFVFWTNTHGGWLVGVGTFGVWSAAKTLTSNHASTTKAAVAGVGVVSVAGTLLNPYGIGLWRFLLETVGFQRSDIVEWLPITSAPPMVLALWIATVLLVCGSLLRRRLPIRWDHLLIIAMLAVASARVNRLDAFTRDRSPVPASIGTPTGATRRWIRHAGIAMVLATLAWTGSRLRCINMDGFWVPDARAARFIAHNNLKGRLVPAFAWGEYAIWHFPSLNVSIDGRRETVYGEDVVSSHVSLYSGEPDGLRYVDDVKADYIWLPRAFPAVPLLPNFGWTVVFDGVHSVILARDGTDVPSSPPVAKSGPRCFPGP